MKVLALFRLFLFLLMVQFLVIVDAQRTVTRTETSTRITTVTVTKNFVCAKLVNVTGTCRRARGFLIDEPVILTFDDEFDETFENELHNLLHPQFIPSRTLRVEVTPLVMLPAMQLPSNHSQHSFNYYHHPRLTPLPRIHVIQPSVQSDTRYEGRNKIGLGTGNPEPRIYFSQINALFNRIVNNLRPRQSVTVTITNFISQTTSVTVSGTTSTFFIMSCTPNPFTFSTCPARRSSPN